MKEYVWLNNKILPLEKAKISVMDRGYLYGDGVYEAVRVYEGKIFRAEHHWRRLDASAKALAIKIPWPHAVRTDACQKIIRANKLQNALLRLTVSRGVGTMGYDPSSAKHPTGTVVSSQVRSDLRNLWEKGVKVAIVHVRRNPIESLSPLIKHTNCINGILAKMEALKEKAFEGIFLNMRGYLTEGTISNLFLIKNKTIYTPELECGLLSGVTRSVMIDCAKQSGFHVKETQLRPEALLQADEAFLTSTTMEAMPIVKVSAHKIGAGRPGTITKILHRAFRQFVCRELRLSAKWAETSV